jgi:SAM-dependent methyltransferase
MTNTIPSSHFADAYADVPQPWDIPGPQPALVAVAGRITGKLLDSGCGTGENAIFFAARGCDVTGFDPVPLAIERAKAKASERALDINFFVGDALTMETWTPNEYDNVIDSGVFHVFSEEDARKYARGLNNVLKPGGRYYMLVFSDAEPGTQGPHRIPKQMIYDVFADGWDVESIEATRYAMRLEYQGTRFSVGGAHNWFAIIRKL